MIQVCKIGCSQGYALAVVDSFKRRLLGLSWVLQCLLSWHTNIAAGAPMMKAWVCCSTARAAGCAGAALGEVEHPWSDCQNGTKGSL
jgi:hypothetical protein